MILVGRFLPAGYSEIQPGVFTTYNVPLPSMQSPDGSSKPIVMRLSGLGFFAAALYTKTVLLVYSVTNKRCRARSGATGAFCVVASGAVNVGCDTPP
jgi:hypothetical protein